jgi:hypothetical protein
MLFYGLLVRFLAGSGKVFIEPGNKFNLFIRRRHEFSGDQPFFVGFDNLLQDIGVYLPQGYNVRVYIALREI